MGTRECMRRFTGPLPVPAPAPSAHPRTAKLEGSTLACGSVGEEGRHRAEGPWTGGEE